MDVPAEPRSGAMRTELSTNLPQQDGDELNARDD